MLTSSILLGTVKVLNCNAFSDILKSKTNNKVNISGSHLIDVSKNVLSGTINKNQMNFTINFKVRFTTIAFTGVLLFLCGHS